MKCIPRIVLTVVCFSAVTASAQNVPTIRAVDFDNFTYAWNDASHGVPTVWKWLTSPPEEHFRMVDGIHHFHSPGQNSDERRHSPLISVDSVTYGDLDGDGIDEAVIALNYSTGGTVNWDYLYVYKLYRGQVRLLARMQTGSRADGGLVRDFVRQNLLVVDFADSNKRIADCCSEGFVRISYRWRDGQFSEEGDREQGKIYLRKGAPRPRFQDYRVRNIYHGEPDTPVITKEFRGFRRRIREGAKSEVESLQATIRFPAGGVELNATDL